MVVLVEQIMTYSEDVDSSDINMDGIVDILDVMALINSILSDEELTPESSWAMDMDFSENLNVLDVIILVNFILFH